MTFCFLAVAALACASTVTSQVNTPPFFTNEWLWQMSENDTVGAMPKSTWVVQDEVRLLAYDYDNDVLTFGVKGDIGTKYFTVDAYSGTVKLKKAFDREVDNTYIAKFTVSDGINIVEKEATISVTDVNDNEPLFDQTRYEVRISEDAPSGTEVLRISASDPDLGYGGIVSYSLAQNQGGDAAPFELRADSGELILRGGLAYEKTSSYRLLATATDGDNTNPLSSTAIVVINVLDVQDSEPEFLNLPYDTTISEDVSVGATVVRINAQDGDRGEPNDISYSLVSGNEAEKFMLQNGNLRVASPIDRDVNDFSGVFSLTVRATEISTRGSQGGAFREVSFDVTVNDVNDERAEFDSGYYQVAVSENFPVGSALPLEMRVTDNDQGANGDVTMSVNWRDSDAVTVSPVTFRHQSDVTIALKRPLDYESAKRLQFRVFANESNSPKLFTSCDVVIDVINENDNAPVFDQNHYVVNASESFPVGQTLIRLTATDADLGRYGRVSYSVDSNRGEIAVGRKNGEVRLLVALDHEAEKRKQFVITARDAGPDQQSAHAILTINVEDANDNSPQFEQNLPTPTVMENRRMMNLATIKATDADSFPNNVLSYSIEDGDFSAHFQIETNDENFGVLSLIEPLDFEALPDGEVRLTVSATDSGFLRSTAQLVVVVQDENDHRPEFVQVSNFTTDENVGGGILIGSVQAVDRDSENNGRVSYYVTKGQKKFGLVFRLNEKTGEVTTKPGTSPDYETQSLYEITITAEDGGNPPLSTTAEIRITINDLNDNPPVFDENNPDDVTVLENSVLRDVTVTARDADSGNNGIIRYSIVQGDNVGLFVIDDVTGDVRSTRELDYEAVGSITELVIQAEDQSSMEARLTATTTLTVNVVDVNDNSPTFARGLLTSYSVLENIAGPVVGKFVATDKDSGENGRINYYILQGNGAGRFAISPLEGELRVAHGTELDREDQAMYNLTICAEDSGSPPRNSTINIDIVVEDVNDNSPMFVDLPKRVNLSENTVIGTMAFRLVAVDPDSADFGRVEYSLESEQGAFVVNRRNGKVFLEKPLDREVTRDYSLHVTARDNPQNPRNSRSVTKTVVISVDDVNDEKPTFVGTTPYRATILENSPPGTQLSFTGDPLLAVDGDEGSNAEVTYALIRDPTSFFAIDANSGQIYTTRNIDRESLRNDVVYLTVRASDVGDRYTDVTVTVYIDDVNDNAPRFVRRRVRTRVLESVQPGHVAARMTASDPDKGRNGEIFYRIQSGAFDKFAINTKTGVIYLAPGQSLDRETTSQYTLSIVATDQAPINPLSSTAVVIILVDDVNDSRPRFLTTFQRISIDENSAIDSKIAQLVAIDNDLEARLQFAMTTTTIYDAEGRPLAVDADVDDVRQSENDFILNWFQLNATTGKILLSSDDLSAETTVDREKCSSIFINFIVTDEASATEEMSTSIQQMTLQIEIDDQNDNSPQIHVLTREGVTAKGDVIIVDVTEECAVGTSLLSVDGRDADQGSNGKVEFEIVGNKDLIRLDDKNSGLITSAARIDREQLAPSGGPGWINFTLVARDLGLPAKRATQKLVRMRVNDVNDNTPRFLRSSYEAEVSEDAASGTVVTTVQSLDADDGDFGDVTYRLRGASEVFEIHPKKGTIYVRGELDRETAEEYSLTVVAVDNAKDAAENRHQNSVQVTISVLDVNDNRPVFDEARPRALTVLENTPTGRAVARVTATDSDKGVNGQVTYALQSDVDYFAIDPFTGDVTVSRQIVVSRRHPTAVNLTVIATDGGGLESNMTLKASVVDFNDHAPVFLQPNVNVIRIDEEQPGGTFVTQVSASDDDIGLNAQVRYNLVYKDSVEEEAFLIDDVTGRIVTSRRLDRERRRSYYLQIEAHDLGYPQQENFKQLTVKLRDINDNRPSFATQGTATQSLTVAEDAKIGFSVGRVRGANDPDQNAKIFYHILSQDGDQERPTFCMSGDKLVLAGALDRETTDRYVLIIGATNNPNFTKPLPFGRWDAVDDRPTEPAGLLANRIAHPITPVWDPSRDSSLLRMTVVVDDVIDERPAFSRDRYVTAVEASAHGGSAVVKMNASDPDINDFIEYDLVSCMLVKPNNKTVQRRQDFVINSETGVIRTSAPIIGNKGRYVIKVRARDSENFSSVATLEVLIKQKSHRLKFVVGSPPEAVMRQREKFTEVLQNLTGSIVTVDKVQHHVTPQNQRDITKSDVTIRIFDGVRDVDQIAQKLKRGSSALKRLFRDYSFYEVETRNKVVQNDVMGLRIGLSIMFMVLLLVIVFFLACLFHMRRTYREKIKRLHDEYSTTPQQNGDDNMCEVLPDRRSDEKISSNDQLSCDEATNEKQPIGKVESRRVQRSFTTDAPALASSLLWSPSQIRRPTRSMEGRNLQQTHHEAFDYDITLHATGCDKALTPLHGSDSGSSF